MSPVVNSYQRTLDRLRQEAIHVITSPGVYSPTLIELSWRVLRQLKK